MILSFQISANPQQFDQPEIFQIDNVVDSAGQHFLETALTVATAGWPGQRQQAVQGITGTFGVGRCQAAVSRESRPDEFHGLLADDFANTVGIQGHSQAVGDQVPQCDRPTTLMAALDALN